MEEVTQKSGNIGSMNLKTASAGSKKWKVLIDVMRYFRSGLFDSNGLHYSPRVAHSPEVQCK